VAGWLAKNRSAAICDYDLKADPLTVFDLSVSSTDPVVMTDEPQASRAIFNRIASDGAVAGIGRYDEPRVVYTAERYKMKTWTGMQNRTVHLGIDVFLLPGHRIYAPYDGVVHAVFDNASNQSYGPTVILRHETDDWISFHTLYGHLARGALSVVEPGQAVAAGDLIGMVGEVSENGGWTPHLHFQVITDMLGYANDFPGVALAEQRSVWLSLSPDPNLILGIRDTRMAMQRAKKNDVHFVRQRYVGPSLSLSYDEPLHIVRGRGARLFDSDGRAYLDCVNNVCHVGHCNPEVVAAAAGQMRTLNTNTRYLHRHLVAYAERLAATLPDPLQVCFFVNSGSEANDLALRMAQTHTGRTSTLVIEAAYHGNLSSLIATSPYKFDGAGGSGKPTGTYVTALPDTYRGLHRGADAASRYASDVKHQLQTASEDRLPVAAFLFESIIGCGGQLDPPPGYLKKACAFARDAGALCIADEVQIGFGRVGTSFWGFERSGVVPDIVTMGKPIGNGHPMGAVVTTPEIAQSFANGMEYFNTFGGNPVSCAVGLAVLDVLENEGLQEHAHEVGSYLIERLRRLIDQHSVVGDVRGSGLFLGIELVTDRISREPAAVIARYVINRARTNGVLLSLDGPDENVIKIKPPLVFSIEDADLLVATISEALAEY